MKHTQKAIEESRERFIEKGADLEHDRWSHWQRYMHMKMIIAYMPDGERFAMLPIDLFHRWERQIGTEYKDLPENEKESDRKETRNYLPHITHTLSEVIDGQIKDLERMYRKVEYGTEEIEAQYEDRGFNTAIYKIIAGLREVKKEL